MGGITGLATAARRYALIICLPDRAGDEAIGRHPCCIPRLQGSVANRTLETIHLPRWRHGFRSLVNGSASACAMRIGHGGALYRFSRDSATGSWSDLEVPMDKNCRTCFGIGLVCENHPVWAWDELGCTCGAGEPCKCNETGGVDEPDVGQVIVEDGPGATSRLASWRAAEVHK
jgi:hypothetical protein